MSKKQKVVIAGIIVLLLAAACVGVFAIFNKSQQTNAVEPTPEEFAEIIKPAVVRVVHHITGTVTIPQIDFKLEDLSVSVEKNKSETTNVDEYFTGSGFIVSPDGYILTNAHVASTEMLKRMITDQVLQNLVTQKTAGLSDQQINTYFKDASSIGAFKSRLIDAIEGGSTFSLTGELSVLNPSSDEEDLEKLAKQGFPAQIVSLHDGFLDDEKDIALLKISQNNLPTVRLGNSENINTGQKIFVFGFPATAEFNYKTPLESTFTQGIISSLKFSSSKDFKIFQTDAKISQGSSGGPLFNEQGEVVGIVTFETGELEQSTGDNFAFAVPISLAKQILKEKNISNLTADYESHFKKGLAYFHTNQCVKATKEFTEASQTNKNFTADKYINPYLEKCQQSIQSGTSVDGSYKLLKAWLSQVTSFVWFVIIGRILLVLLGLWVIWQFILRIRKDEQELTHISRSLEQEKDIAMRLIQELKDRGVDLPVPDEETHASNRTELGLPHPHVENFVKEARAVGLPDDHITQELKKGGWEDHEIHNALHSK